MTFLTAAIAIAALILGSTAVGVWLRSRVGRLRLAAGRTGALSKAGALSNTDVGSTAAFGARGTLVQFSTEFCSPCRAASRVLGAAAASGDGIVHIDVDLTGRPDLARRFNILSTPTTLILDGGGVPVARIAGAPRPAELASQLAEVLGGRALGSKILGATDVRAR